MHNYMLVRHKVKDFSAWKQTYDQNLPKRKDAGLTERYVLHEEDDQNAVTIMFEAEDLGRAKAFSESQDLKDTMQKAGVISKPEIHFLNS